jgi:hypothetical protein
LSLLGLVVSVTCQQCHIVVVIVIVIVVGVGDVAAVPHHCHQVGVSFLLVSTPISLCKQWLAGWVLVLET